MKQLKLTLSALLLCIFVCLSATAKDKIHVVFIGNSITYGATLSDPGSQAPPVIVGQLLEKRTKHTVKIKNCGVSGITTYGFLPGRGAYNNAVSGGEEFSKEAGPLYFSIMLGTNDSAEKGPEGAPVDVETYKANIKKIIDALHEKFPKAKFVLNYPIWYSPTTHNGATYLQAGLDRLKSYHPVIDEILSDYASTNPGMVNAGLKEAYDFFEGNKDYFTSESGNSGTFWLHPNAQGAVKLAGFWTDAIMKVLATDGIGEGEEEDDTWVKGKDLLTDSVQISTNTMESYQFSTSNLIRPEIEGYGTGQYIYHCSWTNPLPKEENPYLQFHLYEAQSDIFFHMISSEWNGTYDTPQDMDIYATNTPDDENSWKKVVELTDIVTAVAHPIDYYSPHINLGDSYTDLRFVVKKNVNGRTSETGGLLFNLGRFQLIKAESTDTPIKKLQKLLDDISEKDPQYKAGTEPGYYSEEAILNYTTAYEEANYALSQELSDEEYTKAEQNLRKAYKAVEASLVKVGEGYFYFVNAYPEFNTVQGVEKAMCVLSNGKLGWNTFDKKDPKFLFKVTPIGDGTYSIKNVYCNKYIGTVKGWTSNVPLTDQSQTLQTITQIGTNPQFFIANTANDLPYFANGSNNGNAEKGEIINNTDGANSPAAWYFITQNDTQLIDSLISAGPKDYFQEQVIDIALRKCSEIREKASEYEPCLTEGSQLSSNNVQAGFPPSNLIRPESDGYGTNQYIFHTSWSSPQTANEYVYLQVNLKNPLDVIKFRMISSEWQYTYDTPKDVEIYASNTPDDEASWKKITELKNIVTEITHPVKYTSPFIKLGESYSNVRFLVKSTVNNRKNASGGFYVSLGRFQVYSTTQIPNSEYFVVEGMKNACDNYDNYLATVNQKIADGTITSADIDKLYDYAKEIDRLYVDRDSLDAVFSNLIKKGEEAYDNATHTTEPSILSGDQITSNTVESDQFAPANLIRPESEGYGTNQYIYHSSWSNPLPATEYPYLQVRLAEPKSSLQFSMISCEWTGTCDTPEDMEVLVTNTPDDENSWKSVKEFPNIVTGSGQEGAHPVRYTSPMIELGGNYTYVRFLVKKTINMRATTTGGFLFSLGRFQVYTESDPERVQYNYNPEVKAAADELKALIDAGKTKGTHEVVPADIAALEKAIANLLDAYADTTEISKLYKKMIEWSDNMEVGDEIGTVDDQSSIDDFVAAVEAARNLVSNTQPVKSQINNAIKAINEAKAAILEHTKQIEPNKWYYIYSRSTEEYCASKAMYLENTDAGANINYGLYTSDEEDPAYLGNPYAMWRFVPIEGTDYYSIQNLATSHSFAPTSGRGNENPCKMQNAFSPFRVDYIGMGQLQFVSINENNVEEYPLHAQERNSIVVPWATSIDGASCWAVEAVEDESEINFPLEKNSISVMTLPFDVPAGATSIMSLNENLLTYSVKNITVDAEAGKTTVELTLCEDVKAGVPFIVIEGDYTQYDPENTESASLYTMLPENVDTVAREANGLVGTLEGCDLNKEGYGYMRNGKLNVTTGTALHINGMSGWLDLEKVTPQEGAADVVISVDGIINDINEINAAAAKARVNVYTVDGTLVKKNVSPSEAVVNLSKGIYIVGKKKVLVK